MREPSQKPRHVSWRFWANPAVFDFMLNFQQMVLIAKVFGHFLCEIDQ